MTALLIIAILAVVVAIWCIEALPADGCRLHDWQPEHDGGLRCVKCHREPE